MHTSWKDSRMSTSRPGRQMPSVTEDKERFIQIFVIKCLLRAPLNPGLSAEVRGSGTLAPLPYKHFLAKE